MLRVHPGVLIALVLAAAAFAACGGNGGDKTATKAAGTSGGSTPAADTTPVSGATPAGTANPEIQAIANKFANSTFKATYKTSGSQSADLGAGDLVLEKDGDAKFRFEITTNQDGQDVSSVFIETADLSAFCLKQAGDLGALVGVDPNTGICFNDPASGSSGEGGSLRDLFTSAENINVTLLEKSNRTIAGQEGVCYRTQDNDGGQISNVCFNSGGVLLYIKNEGDDSSEIEAQTVSASVSDSDFQLPYELKELPGGADLGQ